MKKFLKTNLVSLVSLFSILILSFGIILLSNSFKSSPEKELFGKVYEVVTTKKVNKTSDRVKISTLSTIKVDSTDGKVYSVEVENTYGKIGLLVGILKNSNVRKDVLSVSLVEIQQDYSLEGALFIDKYFKNIENPRDNYKKFPTLLDKNNLSTDATVIGKNTTASITNAILKVVYYEYNIVLDPLIDIYGEGYVRETPTTLSPTITKEVISKEGTVLGYILNVSGIIVTRDSGEFNLITTLLFNSENKLVGHLFENGYASDDYSKDVYSDLLKSLLGKDRSDLLTGLDNSHLLSGATLSSPSIYAILEDASNVEV
ncbi:MAG: hypothetical protein LBV58_00725 [Acholeplasmatales bacterium]|jgi:hypothetical protein|nr:hypothetical protein [Acholeplasmatales bacterium]